MKKVYWIILIVIVFSGSLIALLIINAERGIKVNVVDVGTFGIEFYLEGTPLYKETYEETRVTVIIDTFEIEGRYLIGSATSENLNKKYESLIGFLASDEFLEYLNLTWDSDANDILSAIQKKEVRIKKI